MKKNENEHNKKNQINCDPAVENNLLNLLRNREDFKKWYWRLVIMVMKYKILM